MAKSMEKKPSVADLRKKKAKEIIDEMKRKMSGERHGFILKDDFERLEKLVT